MLKWTLQKYDHVNWTELALNRFQWRAAELAVLLKDEISWSSHSPGGYQKLLTTEVQVQTQSSLCGPCGQRSSGAGLPQGASVPPPPQRPSFHEYQVLLPERKATAVQDTHAHTHTWYRRFQTVSAGVCLGNFIASVQKGHVAFLTRTSHFPLFTVC